MAVHHSRLALFIQIVLVSPQDIAMITWACSKIYRQADPSLLTLLGDKAERMLERFRPGDLAQTLLALAETGAPHAGLFSATVHSAQREDEISTDLGLDTVTRTIQAYAMASPSRGLGVLRSDAERASALRMLRRLRAPLAEGLSTQRLYCSPELASRLAVALVAVREAELCFADAFEQSQRQSAGLSSDGPSSGPSDPPASSLSPSLPSSQELDKPLIEALVERIGRLIPTCSSTQLAMVMSSLEGLDLGPNGLMLAAAAATHMKQLMQLGGRSFPSDSMSLSARRNRDGGDLRRNNGVAGGLLLINAADVVRSCVRLGLNDPALSAQVEQLLLDAEEQWQRSGADAGSGLDGPKDAGLSTLVTRLDAYRLVSLLCDLGSDASTQTGGRPGLRAAIGRLLVSKQIKPVQARKAGSSATKLLVKAFCIYSAGCEASAMAPVPTPTSSGNEASSRVAADAKAEAAASPETASTSAVASQLKDDLLALGKLAGALTPAVLQHSSPFDGGSSMSQEDRAALVSATSRAIATLTAAGPRQVSDDTPTRLQELWDSLSEKL